MNNPSRLPGDYPLFIGAFLTGDLAARTPHLTLAKELDQDRFEVLLARLEQSEWHTGRWSVWIDQLWLMQRGPDEAGWRCIQRIGLRE
jgi:hypothetical protein